MKNTKYSALGRSSYLGDTLINAIVFLTIAVTASIYIPYPLCGDTTMFLEGAKVIANGGVYLRDFWDIKPPGIYFWYYIAGTIFSFDESGVHKFELIWHMVTVALMLFLTKVIFRNRAAVVSLPLFTILLLYANATQWHLGQVEYIVSLPIYASLLLVTHNFKKSTSRFIAYFFVGILAGIIVSLKQVYVAFPATFVLWAWYFRIKLSQNDKWLDILRDTSAGLIGLSVILGAISYYYWRNDSFYQLIWTVFILPASALSEAGFPPISRLLTSFTWLSVIFIPLLPLILLSFFKKYVSIEQKIFYMSILTWLFVGVIAIIIQKNSWWSYHMGLLFLPLGVLASLGLDRLITFTSENAMLNQLFIRWGTGILVASMAATGFDVWNEKLNVYVDNFIKSNNDNFSYEMTIDDAYRKNWEITEFIRSDQAKEGEIYYFGNPLILHFSGRKQAIPVHGWSWDLFPDSMWNEMLANLRRSKPVYFFLRDKDLILISSRKPDLLLFLEENYTLKDTIINNGKKLGYWYELAVDTSKSQK